MCVLCGICISLCVHVCVHVYVYATYLSGRDMRGTVLENKEGALWPEVSLQSCPAANGDISTSSHYPTPPTSGQRCGVGAGVSFKAAVRRA